MKTAIGFTLGIGLLLLLGAGPPTSPASRNLQASGLAGGGPVSGDICIADDIDLSFGGTCAAPDYWCVYNSTGTQWECWSTNVAGPGTDGVIFSVDDGDDIVDFTDGATFGGAVVAPAGAFSAPGVQIGAVGEGFFRQGANDLRVVVNGGGYWFFSSSSFGPPGGAGLFGATLLVVTPTATVPSVLPTNQDADSGICYPGADKASVCVGGVQGITATEASDSLTATFVSGKGQATGIYENTERLTFAANPGDASKVTTSLCPATVTILGITTHVVTAATNCASVDIGDGADVDMFGAATGIADDTKTDNSDATAYTRLGFQSAAFNVTITANGGNCFDGVWDVTCHYIDVIPASDDT